MPLYALGLGQLQLASKLNQPFDATIPVLALTEDEFDTVSVSLASHSEFTRAGLVKTVTLSQLEFTLSIKNDQAVIKVSSKKIIKEPLLDFLLVVQSQAGKMIKEYTVLLDPPKRAEVIKTDESIATVSQSVRIIPNSEQDRVINTPTLNKPKKTQSYGRTKNTDTLWDIALKTRPDRAISVHQMMLAIKSNNPRAFIKKNINGLKSGYYLKIPTIEQIRQHNHLQALELVREQNQLWSERFTKNNTNEATDKIALPSSDTDIKEKQTIEPKEVVAEEVQPRLQLIGTGEESLEENQLVAFGNEQVDKLREQLTVAEQVIANQERENEQIQHRVQLLEKQIETLRKLIEIQSPELSRLQSEIEKQSQRIEESLTNNKNSVSSDTTNNEISTNESKQENEKPSLTQELMTPRSDAIIDKNTSSDNISPLGENGVSTKDDKATKKNAPQQPVKMEDGTIEKSTDVGVITDSSNTSTPEPVLKQHEESEIKTLLSGKEDSDKAVSGTTIQESKITEQSDSSAGETTTDDTVLDSNPLIMQLDEALSYINQLADAVIHVVFIYPIQSISVVVILLLTLLVIQRYHSRYTTDDDNSLLAPPSEKSPQKLAEGSISEAKTLLDNGDLSSAEQMLGQLVRNDPLDTEASILLLQVYFLQQQSSAFITLADNIMSVCSKTQQETIKALAQRLLDEPPEFLLPISENKNAVSIDEANVNNISTLAINETYDTDMMSIDREGNSLSNKSVDTETIDIVLNETRSTLSEESELELTTIDGPLIFESNDIEQKEDDISDTFSSFTIDPELSQDKTVDEQKLEAMFSSPVEDDLSQKIVIDNEQLSTTKSNNIELSLSDLEEINAIETKIELALAHIEISDPAGAKMMLEEVMIEGNDEQKERAQTILNTFEE